MKRKIVIVNTIITAVALLLMFSLGILVTRSNYSDITERRIKELTGVYVASYQTGGEVFAAVDGEYRVTVIDAEGNVLSDSAQTDVSQMENHSGREEIIAARKGEPKVFVRESDTFGINTMYYAEKAELEGNYVFIRVSMPVSSANSFISKSVPLTLLIMFFAAFLSALASVFAAGGLLKPLGKVKDGLASIEKGTFVKIPPTTDDSEINRMLSDINEVSERLEKSIAAAESGKERLGYILDNVSDGIAVFDGSLKIEALNGSAHAIFGVKDGAGMTIEALTAEQNFISAVTDCAEQKSGSIFQINIGGKWYLTTVRYTENDLIIAVLTDITAAKEGEKMRLEFFANASHELKTPLTAIKGFNDMISLKSDGGEIAGYSRKIEKETARMLALIDDMLDLSKLENTAVKPQNLPEINLREVAEDVAESLKILADRKKVRLSVSGELKVRGEREHFYELLKNLAENAVRYNNEGGSAEIKLSDKNGVKKLAVKDDGIGISAENQTRIFERFYRVDKSRSRATGGTGLGLAIVKHVCELYGAEISLKSRVGAGTSVTVTFSESK